MQLAARVCELQRPAAQVRRCGLEPVAGGVCAAQADALAGLMTEKGRELAVEQAVQFFFDEQWCALREYCGERQIRILGDVAIFVNYDSAEVWTHPELFELDEKGGMVRVSGVPPDYYSATGQRGAIRCTGGTC